MGSKRGTTGEFASLLRELGDYPDMAFGRITPDGQIKWIHIPHEIGDGMTGMQDLLTREGYTLGPTPQGREVKGNRFWLFLKMLGGPKVPKRGRRIPWKDFDRAAPAERPEPAWTVLDEAHTAALAKAAKARGVSANSLLLWALDRAVERLLSDPARARMWLVPVNMRGVVPLPAAEANQTSEIPCVISPDATPKDVHEEIKSRLSRNVHVFNLWVRRYLLWRMSREKLLNAIRYARANRPQYWVGCFSNVGEWSPPGGQPGVTWCAGAPLTFDMALGAVVMTWQGRLTMTFGAHPGVHDHKRRAQEILDAWKARLIQLADEHMTPRASERVSADESPATPSRVSG